MLLRKGNCQRRDPDGATTAPWRGGSGPRAPTHPGPANDDEDDDDDDFSRGDIDGDAEDGDLPEEDEDDDEGDTLWA